MIFQVVTIPSEWSWIYVDRNEDICKELLPSMILYQLVKENLMSKYEILPVLQKDRLAVNIIFCKQTAVFQTSFQVFPLLARVSTSVAFCNDILRTATRAWTQGGCQNVIKNIIFNPISASFEKLFSWLGNKTIQKTNRSLVLENWCCSETTAVPAYTAWNLSFGARKAKWNLSPRTGRSQLAHLAVYISKTKKQKIPMLDKHFNRTDCKIAHTRDYFANCFGWAKESSGIVVEQSKVFMLNINWKFRKRNPYIWKAQ